MLKWHILYIYSSKRFEGKMQFHCFYNKWKNSCACMKNHRHSEQVLSLEAHHPPHQPKNFAIYLIGIICLCETRSKSTIYSLCVCVFFFRYHIRREASVESWGARDYRDFRFSTRVWIQRETYRAIQITLCKHWQCDAFTHKESLSSLAPSSSRDDIARYSQLLRCFSFPFSRALCSLSLAVSRPKFTSLARVWVANNASRRRRSRRRRRRRRWHISKKSSTTLCFESCFSARSCMQVLPEYAYIEPTKIMTIIIIIMKNIFARIDIFQLLFFIPLVEIYASRFVSVCCQ